MRKKEKQPEVAETSTTESPSDDRRGFLTKSTMLLAALGMTEFMLPDAANAALNRGQVSALNRGQVSALNREQVSALKTVMDMAMRSMSMEEALASDAGKMVPREAHEALKVLTSADLRSAAMLNSKLSKIASMVVADNNGWIGM